MTLKMQIKRGKIKARISAYYRRGEDPFWKIYGYHGIQALFFWTKKEVAL